MNRPDVDVQRFRVIHDWLPFRRFQSKRFNHRRFAAMHRRFLQRPRLMKDAGAVKLAVVLAVKAVSFSQKEFKGFAVRERNRLAYIPRSFELRGRFVSSVKRVINRATALLEIDVSVIVGQMIKSARAQYSSRTVTIEREKPNAWNTNVMDVSANVEFMH